MKGYGFEFINLVNERKSNKQCTIMIKEYNDNFLQFYQYKELKEDIVFDGLLIKKIFSPNMLIYYHLPLFFKSDCY